MDDSKMTSDKPAVLIMGDTWGSPFQSGTASAVRLLAHTFNAIGLSVHCTVLKMTDQEYEEARRNNVELICPNPIRLLKHRRQNPDHDWLYSCDTYFPDIAKIKNVQIILGFGMLTSDATLATKERIISMAQYYITYLWPTDVSPPSIIGCNRDELLARADSLEEESDLASATVSVDGQTFEHFEQRFQEFTDKQFLIYPVPDDKYLNFKLPKVPRKDQRLQILSYLEESDFEDMQSHQVLAKALNVVAAMYSDFQEQPPKWKVMGTCEAKESHIKRNLNPHSQLKIVPSSMPTLKYMEREMFSSHLILIPPSPGKTFHHLMLSTMAIGIPFLVSTYSPCHELIKKFFPLYEDDLVVDMENVDAFQKRITRMLKKPDVYFQKASEVKEILRTTAMKSIGEMNEEFIDKVKQDIGYSEPLAALGVAESLELKTPRVQSSEGALLNQKTSDAESHHIPGHVHLHVNIIGGIPKEGVSMRDVERAYYKRPEVVEGMCEQINNIHRGISVDGIDGNSVRYSIACETLDALECLWREYEALNLNRLVTSTTITDKVLKEIDALYLSIQTTLDIEEYEQCWTELLGKEEQTLSTSLEVDDDTDKARVIEENTQLRRETASLKSTVAALEERIIEYNARIQNLNSALRDSKELRLNIETLKGTILGKNLEIEILESKLRDQEKGQSVLFEEMLKLRSENTELKETVSTSGEETLKEENKQLREDVTTLKTKVERLEEKMISKEKEIDRLESEFGLKAAGVSSQWSLSRLMDVMTGPVKFRKPRGVTINRHGDLAVADTENHRVQLLNLDYEPVSELRFDGIFTNDFQPYQIAVTTNEEYFMTDIGNKQVVMYNLKTKTTKIFLQDDDVNPKGIALMIGYFLVTDFDDRKIVKCDMNGHSVAEVKGHSQSKHLVNPRYIAVNSANNVLASDRGAGADDGSVRVFNEDLEHLTTLVSNLVWPYGIDVDIWDNVYVVEFTKSRVIKYTEDGKREVVISKSDITNPRHITISKYGTPRMVVSETDFHRVKVFTM
ncbi:uncharacterized protein LOC144448441 [Glandiceps talaboti]